MEHHAFDFSDVLIFLLAAVLLVPLFGRLRVSPILAYLVAGIAIGPFALGLIGEVETVRHLAEFGVIFLLFAIGLELSIDRLYGMRREVFGLGTLQVLLTGLAIGGVAYYFGSTTEAAILIGGGLAFSSTAMVMQILSERGESSSRAGRSAFAVLLFQDLAVVPLLALIPLLGSEGPNVAAALGTALGKALLALSVIFIAGRFLVRPLFRGVARTHNRELFVGTTLLVVLGTSWATGQLGLSLALGAFLAGLLIAETEYRHQVEGDIAPFKGLFLGLFFMSVGMDIDLKVIWDQAPKVLGMVASLLLIKFVVITTTCRLFRFPLGLSVHVGLLLAQGGEFAFVLFGLGTVLGILPLQTGQLLLLTVSVTMMVTPLLAALGRRLADRLSLPVLNGEGEMIQELGHLRDHVIVAGFGRVGQTVVRLLEQYQVPYVAIDLDHSKVAEGRKQGYQVFYGSGSQLDVLNAAGVDRARMIVMTLDKPTVAEHAVKALHKHYPQLEIVVRGRDIEQSIALREAGASSVIPEALEASLQLSSCVLRRWGIPVDAVELALEEIRREDYAPVVATIIAGEGRTKEPATAVVD